jgi:hypothetical protein
MQILHREHDEWPNFLGNKPMVEALLSRLRHGLIVGLAVQDLFDPRVVALVQEVEGDTLGTGGGV